MFSKRKGYVVLVTILLSVFVIGCGQPFGELLKPISEQEKTEKPGDSPKEEQSSSEKKGEERQIQKPES
ncbi:hypothetical protein [Desulfuribacillus stibiiarsenatis]|uniref:hypothetical protein n=1 Tax=Desulfuribacillus stibiiarsenatis TaxID=1390249 RepID=UPI001C40840D|nr:hypothetical protein [Desulfuribacillus stibiiarsenatis]